MTAIYVENMCKNYGGSQILQNISINIEKGTIYGLIGSSGCGKTTLISCIVGLEKWESGELRVFGSHPGTKMALHQIGYMPQETALYKYLRIQEVVQFYGFIYKMTRSEIKTRWKFLSNLLELPRSLPLIGDLSGGQTRRASLALALIHSPKLLILDEPTAGVDPLLRRNICNYLQKLVQNSGTTVLMTTHYYEEARFSDVIGVMRKGRLLVEDSPTNILEKYQCDLLENAVVQLCREDDSNLNLHCCPNQKNYINELYLSQNLNKNDNYEFSMFQTSKRIYGLTIVMLLTLMRNPVFFGLTLLLPASQGFLTLLTTGRKPFGLHFGIVNNELQNWTSKCNSEIFSGSSSCELSFLSCQFLNQLEKGSFLTLDSFNSEDIALSQVHLGNIWGYLTIPENFSQNSVDFAISKYFASNESLEGSRIHVYLDRSLFIQGFLLVKHLFASYMDFASQVSQSCEMNGNFDKMPLHFREPVYGTYEDDYTVYIIVGVVLMSYFGIGLGLTGISHVSDRRQGTLKRACAAGLQTADIIFANFVTQTFITILQLIIWNLILYFVFGFVILGSPWLWIVFCVLIELIGVGCGLLLGQLFCSETQVLFVLIFLFQFLVYFGCVLFPVEYMPEICKYFAYFVPTFSITMSVRSLVTRGFGISHPIIWTGLIVGVGWITVLSVLIVVAFKITGNR